MTPAKTIYVRLEKDFKPDSMREETLLKGSVIMGFELEEDGETCWSIPFHNWTHNYESPEALRKALGVLVPEAEFLAYQAQALNPPAAPAMPMLAETLPSLENGEEMPEIEGQDPSSLLPVPTKSGNPGDIRNKALGYRQEAEAFFKSLASAKATLRQHAEAAKRLVEIQSEALQERMAAMRKDMEVVGHALDVINLYLGAKETVEILREGEKAPAETPITIRQRLVYMDEEAMFLDQGDGEGIDCHGLADFDRLLVEENLLDQILPEKKGVVVARVTKKARNYREADPITRVELNEANAQTYWIVRNGECLWRFWSGLELPDKGVLFPSDVQEVSEHRPGSREYQHEVEKAQGERLAYLKAGLLLQGLIDRTNIFAPFPDKTRPHVTNPMTWEGKLHLLRDASGLGEGRPPIREWMRGANQNAEGGERIVVGHVPREERHPRYAAGLETAGILTLRKSKGGFRASFPRTDAGPAAHGSVELEKTGDNWLNIDEVTLEEIEFYLRSREARENYNETLPLLIKARKAKLREEEEEAPFIALLERELEAMGGEPLKAKAKSLVRLWKTRNKIRRALVGNEKENAKAWAFLIKTAEESLKGKKPDGLPPMENCVLAVRLKDGRIRTYEPEEGEPFPSLCVLKEWKKGKAGWVERKAKSLPKRFTAPESTFRHLAENILAENKEWLQKARRTGSRIPRDTINRIPPGRWEDVAEEYKVQKRTGTGQSEIVGAFETCNLDGRNQRLHICRANPAKHYMESFEVALDRQGLPETPKRWYPSTSVRDGISKDLLKGKPAGWENKDRWEHWRILWVDSQAIERIQKEKDKSQTRHRRKESRRQWVRKCIDSLRVMLETLWKNKEYSAFLEDGGNPSFFDDHLRTIKKPQPDLTATESVLQRLQEGEYPSSKLSETTLEDLLALANVEAESLGRHPLQEARASGWKSPKA